MFEKRIQIEQGKTLTLVEMLSNVSVAVWDEADVLLRVDSDDEEKLAVQETETGPAVSAQVSCNVQVPDWLPVKIREVRGNLQVKDVANLDAQQVRGNLKLSEVGGANLAEVYGNLGAYELASLQVVGTVFGDAVLKETATADVQNVRGNLVVKEVQKLRASRIGGNLNAKEVGGGLDVDQVGGNAMLKAIDGPVTVEQIAGNLVAKDLLKGAKVAKIGGNLVLNGEIGPGHTYQFHARGNASLRLPEEASAHLTLKAKGKIMSSVKLADQAKDGGTLTGTLGEGGAEIAVEAGGNLMLGGGGPTIRIELGDEISQQVEESLRAIDLEAIGRQVGEELEAAMSRLQVKLESVDWERIGTQTQQTVERAMEQMRLNMDRMVEKAAHHQEKLERRLEREAQRRERMEHKRQRAQERQQRVEVRVGAQNWAPEEAYEPAEPEPDLDEERLSILRMVEQGQISPEEAEMLLDALQ